jgi:Uma2 family endonuclease
MEPQRKPYLTPEEYLAFERQSEIRHEYLDGEVFAMSGGSLNHSLIIGNLTAQLHGLLRERPCRVCPSTLRVFVPATGLYTYPDVDVVCGEPQLQDSEMDTLLNPTLIAEVLSPSTEAYDRGKKFENYQTIESLREYLLVAQDGPRVSHFLRQDGEQWLLTSIAGFDSKVSLPTLGIELSLAEVYYKVDFSLT